VLRKMFLVLVLGLVIPTHLWATTYYVRTNGSDNAAGTSWATAWATTSKVQSTLAGGDTVYFGTGKWRNVKLTPPKGSASDRTCYACSSFVQGISHLWGSDSVGSWVSYSGNIWKAAYTGSSCLVERVYTLAQDDSLVKWESSLAAVNAAGEFYHDTGKDTIYAWCYANANPNNVDMEASCHQVFDVASDANGYFTVWGFDIRYGNHGVIYFNSAMGSEADSVLISHCNISGISYATDENPACIYAGKGGSEYTPSSWGKDNEVRACTLSNEWNIGGASNHGDGVVLYTQTRFIVDSCYIDGRGRGNVGIIFKNETEGCVARFNTLKRINTDAMRVAYSGQADSFYGNIVIGDGTHPTGGAAILTENPQSNPWYSNSCVWLNNTFYNCGRSGLVNGDGDNGGTGHKLMYNVQFDSFNHPIDYFGQDNKARWTIDSNLIYRPSFASGSFYYNGNVALATWKTTEGFDTHSDTVYSHVGFTDPASGDFSRPNSSQEMNRIYGGRTWTRYGAWQPSGSGGGDIYPPDTVRAVDTTQVNTTSVLLKCHRNDSTDCVGYRVKYNLGSTPPSNVNEGTYGDSSNASGRNDTLFTVNGLATNTQYSFSVFAKDEVSNWSVKGSGSWKTVTTDLNPDITPPDTVKNVDTTQVNAGSVLLKCQRNDSTDCAGYMVRYTAGATAPSTYNSGTFGDSSDANGRNDTLFTVSGLTSNTQYSFSIFAKDEVPNWTAKGSGSSKTVTTKQQLDIFPPDTVKNVDTTQVNTTSVLLKCHRNDSTDCVGYRVKYNLGSTPPSNVNEGTYGDSSNASGRNDTLFTVNGLATNTQYSFSVFAKDEVSNWSVKGSGSWKTVTTDLNPDITPPDTVKNVDTTQVNAGSVLLKCQRNDSTDCAGYMVRYTAGATAPSTYNSGTFGDSSDANGRNDTLFTVSGLTSNTQYSFSIFAKDEVPNWTAKGSTSWIRVTTRANNNCPTSPSPNLPGDGDTILGVRPMLTISNSADVDGDVLVYDFKVCSDSQMTNLVADTTDILQGEGITYWQVNVDLPDESWCWWEARSYDGICHSDWSGNRKFYVKKWIAEVDDSQPDLKGPGNGEVLTNVRPTLEVYSITGFDSLWYYFQIESDSQFTSPVQSEGVFEGDPITSWTVSSVLSAGNYCWRVRAFDGSKFSLWSETGKFTLAPQIYAYPNPFKPSAGDERVVFNNIPIASNIRITTLNGEIVRKFTNTQDSQIVWDVKNQKNEDVASGVYLYFVDFPGGSTSGKIIVIR
jgi:hypothetical protein